MDQNPNPSFVDQAKTSFVKQLPIWTTHFLQAIFHGTFILVRELGKIIREAIGR